MNPKAHALFKQYPLTGTAQLSTGAVPTPYHIYAGFGLFIGGTGDLAAARALLRPEALSPVATTDGRAVMGLWVCNFTQASLGPHHELQVSVFVTERETPAIAPHPLAALTLVLTRPEVHMLCHGLWNNTATVVAYNRELLSLNAQLTNSRIERTGDGVEFDFKDAAGGGLLAGRVAQARRAGAQATWTLMRALGIGRTLAVGRQPWLGLRVANPIGAGLSRNALAQTYTKNDTNVVRYFDRGADQLALSAPPYPAVDFRPECVQYMDGFKFVYLPPE